MMKQHIFFNTRSALLALLLVNTPLLQADLGTLDQHSFNQRAQSHALYAISSRLEAKGLETQTAQDKALALLAGNHFSSLKLQHLMQHPKLQISEDKLYHSLATRALFGKTINLNSYDALIALTQEIKGQALHHTELTALQEVVRQNSSLT